MKKILSLFGVIALMSSISFAYYNDTETADVDVLQAQGYSESTLQAIDTISKLNKGKNSTYQTKYVKKVQSNNKLQNAYNEAKIYLDPAQDDGDFFTHQINFTNTWQGDKSNYSSQFVRRENL